jgi:hypothetical protein
MIKTPINRVTVMKTFSEAEAGRAFTRLAQRRLRNTSIKPADVCLFCWLVGEAVRVNNNPVTSTVSSMQHGFTHVGDGKKDNICPVGLSLNTIKLSLSRLEDLGFIEIERAPARGNGETLTIEIR